MSQGNEELASRIAVLQRRVEELVDLVFFLEVEVLALGNLLIKTKSLSKEDLRMMTDLVLKQKMEEGRRDRDSSPVKMTREELQSAIQEKIKQ